MMSGEMTRRDITDPAARAAVLDLLRPADLPAEIALGAAEADRLHTVLSAYLRVLDRTEGRAAAMRGLLAELEGDASRPATIHATEIPVRVEEVADFDRYFNVRRVDGADPALALLRGLLQTSGAVLALVERAEALPAADIAMQVAGFASYARLLGRICGLEPLR